jgi:hypothetical protein
LPSLTPSPFIGERGMIPRAESDVETVDAA